ncbi:MAG: L-fuculose-phosphate aldolase [Thermodesulfobacteriota bacterium]|nr:L-fuculose-phosphate aldolase [Thermodesulfobacteriota bacterium]
MLLREERNEIVRFGGKLVSSKLTTGTGGNLSLFNRREGLIAISPSGIDYLEMRIEDIVLLDIDGEIIEGSRRPSSESNFHTMLYQKRKDINAIIHTHSIYATTIACLNWEIPAVHYLVGFSGNKVPVAPYATFGTKKLADNISKTIGNYNAVLLANHGLITIGVDLSSTFYIAEEIELVAQIYYQSRCIGKPAILSDKEMDKVIKKFKAYGQKK